MTRNKKNQQIALSDDLSQSPTNDITDKIIAETTPDPLWHPLSPSYDDLLDYADDLDYEGNQITYEWATNEIITHRMGWVRMGIVADRVRRYRLYKEKFRDWMSYCKQVLGKDNWQINKIIKASLTTLEIIREGYVCYPTCMAHVNALTDCCKKTGVHFLKAWQIVCERLPEQSLITANSIATVLGFPPEEKRKINITQKLRDRLQDAAFNDGVTVEKKIEQLLDMEDGIEPESEDEPESEPTESKLELWQQDMQQLLIEHDREIWLISTMAKLINQGKRKIRSLKSKSQLRYQT